MELQAGMERTKAFQAAHSPSADEPFIHAKNIAHAILGSIALPMDCIAIMAGGAAGLLMLRASGQSGVHSYTSQQ